MVALQLSQRQAEYLRDILDMWIEGSEAATADVETDSHDTLEQMLQALDGMHWQFADAVDLRMKLTEALAQ